MASPIDEEYWREIRRSLDRNAEQLSQIIFTLNSGDKYIIIDPYQASLGSQIVEVYELDGFVTKFPVRSICSVSYQIKD